MKRASIIKFNKDNRFIIYPINTLRGGGGIASTPYYIEQNLTDEGVAEKLLLALEHSIVDAPRPLDWKFSQKKYLQAVGMKTMKMLHDCSINISIFSRNGNYHITPTINKGSREGFKHVKEKIIIPIDSTVGELAQALKEAFEKSS